jgi:uncharacterized protein YqeY
VSRKEQLGEDLKAALRAGDSTRKDTLRMLMAAIRNAEIEAMAELDDEGVMGVIQKQAKQRRDSIAEFAKGGRQDLVDREQAQLEVLLEYLPAQATREEVEAAAREVIAQAGASGPRDMAKVMPLMMQRFGDRADGRMVSEVVRSLLSG